MKMLWAGVFMAVFAVLSVIYAVAVELSANRKLSECSPENQQKLQNENTRMQHTLSRIAAELRNDKQEDKARAWGLGPYLGITAKVEDDE